MKTKMPAMGYLIPSELFSNCRACQWLEHYDCTGERDYGGPPSHRSWCFLIKQPAIIVSYDVTEDHSGNG